MKIINNLVSVDKIPNYIKLISDFKNIDLRKTHGVFIATPAKSHFKIAKYFLENNINVFIEKPITLGVKSYKILRKNFK